MPRLQFPFTAGLTPTSVQAIQQLIQQNERRQAQKAAAKAETERLKAQSTRRIGDAIPQAGSREGQAVLICVERRAGTRYEPPLFSPVMNP